MKIFVFVRISLHIQTCRLHLLLRTNNDPQVDPSNILNRAILQIQRVVNRIYTEQRLAKIH